MRGSDLDIALLFLGDINKHEKKNPFHFIFNFILV